ncbi:MAG TPA: PilZ domain-containing protein [Verrucomicrobiae bacterium]|nr:PilZ domain-containing protein [Verrucomicrobiae bacterium]
MSGAERRISPRKPCVVPVRFRIVANGGRETLGLREAARSSMTHEGEVLNLSENGVYFTSRAKLSVGEPLEMHLTLPRELTGRNPEQVRCSARVVHVEDLSDSGGTAGVGAVVDRFETVAASRDWSN